MKIILRPHLKVRLKERQIPDNYPKWILSQPDQTYVDRLTMHHIAIKKLDYNQKLRPMVVVYAIINSVIQVITIYPTTDQEIANRIKSQRWAKNEKN